MLIVTRIFNLKRHGDLKRRVFAQVSHAKFAKENI